MAKKKAAKKSAKKRAKKTVRRTTSASSTARARGGKFHGVIDVETPTEGEEIVDGARVLVAIRRIFFGDIPDPGGNNELSLLVSAETDKSDEGSTEEAKGEFKVELFRYVKDNEPLNITDLVVFSGSVRRHLTLRCSIAELDAASVEKTKQLITQAAGLGQNLVGEGLAKTILGGAPALFGAILSFNEDDQVLVLNHSFYTASVSAGGARSLRAGVYTFKKRKPSSTISQVELELEVLPVS